ADVSGQFIQVRTSGTFTNSGGTLEAKNSGTLNLATLSGNVGTGMTASNGGALVLGGTYTIDTSPTLAAGTALYLQGSATLASPGVISATGASVYIDGTLNNLGTTLQVGGAAGAWYVHGGTISKGTVAVDSAAALNATSSGGTLDQVTLNGNLD